MKTSWSLSSSAPLHGPMITRASSITGQFRSLNFALRRLLLPSKHSMFLCLYLPCRTALAGSLGGVSSVDHFGKNKWPIGKAMLCCFHSR